MEGNEYTQIIKVLALVEGLYDYPNQVDPTVLEEKFKERMRLYLLHDRISSETFLSFQKTYLRCFGLDSKSHHILQTALASALQSVQEVKTDDIVQAIVDVFHLLR